MSVNCVDGGFGELSNVIIDPRGRRLTHVVVQPHDRPDKALLVPVESVRPRSGTGGITLGSTIAGMAERESIQESAYLLPGEAPTSNSDWDVGIEELYPLPVYGSQGPEALGASMGLEYDQHVAMSYHRVPKGEVEIRRESPVNSSDGHHLGHVVGFVIDDQQRIEHLVLVHGHLWGKHEAAIPGSAIDRLANDELTLSLSRAAVQAR
jgi:sporulation protein YlmC with PRC-barrel domain